MDLVPMDNDPSTRPSGLPALSQHGRRVLALLQQQAPQAYAPTCYDAKGRLLATDEDVEVHEKQLWAELVEPAVAKRIERRIKEMEEEDEAAAQQG